MDENEHIPWKMAMVAMGAAPLIVMFPQLRSLTLV